MAGSPAPKKAAPPAEESAEGTSFAKSLQAAAEVPLPQMPQAPVASADPNEMAGQRQNSNVALEPLRTDEQGRVWYQEEVRKPAFARPRGRRVLTYQDTGTKTMQVKQGDYVETFEVAGDQQRVPAQAKITLPSYQVGIYRDPRYKHFKVHVYDERRGFDREDVENYYGGRELVPSTCKRVYVENVLCYDMRSVIATIQSEYRQLQLLRKV